MGGRLARRSRRSAEKGGPAKTPFIMLTGWGGQILEKDKIMESGVEVVLEKPVEIAKLLTEIQEAVRESQRSRAGS